MIPKGNLHAHGGRLAAYLTKGGDGERAELINMQGFASDDLREAFCDIQAIAESQTSCQKPFFHAYVRLPADENLSQEQWIQTANRLEQKLGFDDQPRAVALHYLDDGTTHMHVAWSRIDTQQMKAIDPGLYLRKMKEVCRELEHEWGLREVSSEFDAARKTGQAKRPEFEEARRLDVDVTATRETIRACYDRSDNGPSFAAALAEHGLGLARGDRRDFVVIDAEGGQHALGKRICSATAEEIRSRLGEEFKQSLPTVEEARDQIAARVSEKDQTPTLEAVVSIQPVTAEAVQGPPKVRPNWKQIDADLTEIYKANDTGKGFAAAVNDRGYIIARGDRRDFIVVDDAGRPRSLARMIEGANAADIRSKMVDVDARTLPTVPEAIAQFQAQGALRPISQTAGKIWLAWNLSDSGAGFAEALKERGLVLAAVSREDAAASEQAASVAKEKGNYAASYAENELVVVNGFGGIYRLNQQTTGDSQKEITAYLKTVAQSTLLNLADARDAAREASRAAFIDNAARLRPETETESIIKESSREATNGTDFLQRIGFHRITLARATSSDLVYLQNAAQIAFREDKAFPAEKIKEGEFVAVHGSGGIYRLNPHKLNSELCEALVIDGGGEVLSIEDAREDALGVRAYQGEIRKQIAADREERAGLPNTAKGWEAGHKTSIMAIPLDGVRGVGTIIGIAVKPIERIVEQLIDLLSPSAPAPHSSAPEEPAPEVEPRIAADPINRPADAAAIARAQAAMEAALSQSQDHIDRRQRDDDAGYGYERERTR